MRELIESAIETLGYVQGGPSRVLAPHWRRGGFGTWIFHPAATGRFQKKGRLQNRQVPVYIGPWPGVPVRGRCAVERSNACWVPISEGMTPHGSRHSYKTMMDELGTPKKLQDHQLGHVDGSVQAGYSHVTATMVQRLMDGLTEMWEAALESRWRMAPGSPVAVLDGLLKERFGNAV